MAEETQKSAAEAPAAAAAEVVAVSDVPEAEKPTAAIAEKEATPEPLKEPAAAEEEKVTESASFKEETNVVGELPDPQKKALDELKQLVQEALNKHEFTAPPPPPPAKEEEKPVEAAPAEEATPAAAPVTDEESKPEVPPAEEPKTEEPAKPEPEAAPVAEPSEPVVVAEVIEKVEVVDEDGAKTVEAIEETIVAVAAPAEPSPSEEAPPTEPKEEPEAAPSEPPPPPEEVSIWGIRLLADERSDVVLLKFLRARDFKVKEALAMLKSVVAWRKEFGIEALLEDDLGSEQEKVVFMNGVDKEGHPVCYNAYGEFQNKELYANTFADEEKRTKFLRWRIQFLEKSIRKLDFSPDGICTIVQVNDLKNSPGPFKTELRQATNKAFQLLQDNYPEFVAKQTCVVFINVPWWYLAFYRMINPFFTQRTKSKFVFAGPSKSAETLFKYIAPELVPVQYGGLSREGEQEFSTVDPATEETIKPATKHTVEFPISEACQLVWEARVVGWDVTYGAEFVPTAEDGYTVIVQKSRKMGPAEEPVISNCFKIGEPGKVVLTFDNQSSKKKKLLYRSTTKSSDCA
ncbi:hypothetical protein RJ639_024109 [Escallonia herrerae]|uniref:Uncharacterized protein n=1 Tax=Escallonia herrerae TaxID=1293975 RepID=A0AA88V0A2_9ASTE|nr:hypothetical protein RJ639_024109 [Escallonia herrerae]